MIRRPPRSTLFPYTTPAAGDTGLLAEQTRREIDHWVAKFPPGRQRSACIAALRAAQEQNHVHLTKALMDAVAAYLKLPAIEAPSECPTRTARRTPAASSTRPSTSRASRCM